MSVEYVVCARPIRYSEVRGDYVSGGGGGGVSGGGVHLADCFTEFHQQF